MTALVVVLATAVVCAALLHHAYDLRKWENETEQLRRNRNKVEPMPFKRPRRRH